MAKKTMNKQIKNQKVSKTLKTTSYNKQNENQEFKIITPKQLLEELLPQADFYRGLLILGITKNGSQGAFSSTISFPETAYLIQFANHIMDKHFELKDGTREKV